MCSPQGASLPLGPSFGDPYSPDEVTVLWDERASPIQRQKRLGPRLMKAGGCSEYSYPDGKPRQYREYMHYTKPDWLLPNDDPGRHVSNYFSASALR